jgi:hypothetical protein
MAKTKEKTREEEILDQQRRDAEKRLAAVMTGLNQKDEGVVEWYKRAQKVFKIDDGAKIEERILEAFKSFLATVLNNEQKEFTDQQVRNAQKHIQRIEKKPQPAPEAPVAEEAPSVEPQAAEPAPVPQQQISQIDLNNQALELDYDSMSKATLDRTLKKLRDEMAVFNEQYEALQREAERRMYLIMRPDEYERSLAATLDYDRARGVPSTREQLIAIDVARLEQIEQLRRQTGQIREGFADRMALIAGRAQELGASPSMQLGIQHAKALNEGSPKIGGTQVDIAREMLKEALQGKQTPRTNATQYRSGDEKHIKSVAQKHGRKELTEVETRILDLESKPPKFVATMLAIDVSKIQDRFRDRPENASARYDARTQERIGNTKLLLDYFEGKLTGEDRKTVQECRTRLEKIESNPDAEAKAQRQAQVKAMQERTAKLGQDESAPVNAPTEITLGSVTPYVFDNKTGIAGSKSRTAKEFSVASNTPETVTMNFSEDAIILTADMEKPADKENRQRLKEAGFTHIAPEPKNS